MLNNKIRLQRLDKWAKFLKEEIAPLVKRKPHKWDMENWADDPNPRAVCTSAACAAGWATTIFRTLGLEKIDHEDGFTITYNNEFGSHAVSTFFGISWTEAFSITQPGEYVKSPTPLMVTKSINNVAALYRKGRGELQN